MLNGDAKTLTAQLLKRIFEHLKNGVIHLCNSPKGIINITKLYLLCAFYDYNFNIQALHLFSSMPFLSLSVTVGTKSPKVQLCDLKSGSCSHILQGTYLKYEC